MPHYRFFAEECDHPQGIMVTVDAHNGFGGFLHALLPQIKDACNVDVVTVPVFPKPEFGSFYTGPAPGLNSSVATPIGLPTLNGHEYNKVCLTLCLTNRPGSFTFNLLQIACYGMLCPSDMVSLSLPFEMSCWSER